LVCRITDPNWAPLMALAGGVVTDIGGALSHGAIIAREMGIPAVLNTGDGTLRIPDGAEIAIDGATGAIRILDDGIDIHARSVLNDDPGTAYWSRVNYAEAMPGVASPLGASIWRRNMLEAPYRVFARMGVLPANVEKARRGIAGEAGGFFYGRAAVNVDFIRMIGDRTPGTSGAATEEGFLGGARPGLVTRKRYGRYPVAIAHLVWLLMTMPREVARIAAEADAWWRRATRELADADAQTARFWLSHAAGRFFDLSVSHGVVTMLSPAVWGAVAALAHRYGDHDILLRLSGGYPAVEEVEMSARLFQVADDGGAARHGDRLREGDIFLRRDDIHTGGLDLAHDSESLRSVGEDGDIDLRLDDLFGVEEGGNFLRGLRCGQALHVHAAQERDGDGAIPLHALAGGHGRLLKDIHLDNIADANAVDLLFFMRRIARRSLGRARGHGTATAREQGEARQGQKKHGPETDARKPLADGEGFH
ncbi:MAG: hypothetical protein J0H30_12315, partial [Alphaproteobacteria bacterium]|nr:hypothetical protein [Alphaproteobacteria bacterium]